MTLIRWNPARDLARWSPEPDFGTNLFSMQREINRMFDHLFDRTTGDEERTGAGWMPTVDIAEKDDRYLMNIDLPGVSREDVKITLKDNVLTISGEKKNESEEKDSSYYRSERQYGRFERSFTLPSTVNGERIEAGFTNGVLSVRIPKREETKPKEIQVKVS